MIFLNKLRFLIFSFADLQNLVKSMDSMFPCYSLLSMEVIYLYMVSATTPTPHYNGVT